jgi:hypothetical protein
LIAGKVSPDAERNSPAINAPYAFSILRSIVCRLCS